MSTLAIRGHKTRGKEVIELLEMMGGKNTYGYTGDMESLYFSIYSDTIVYGSNRSFLNDNYVFFTLEEFLEKFPYKVGDKVVVMERGNVVTITDMSWRNGREIIYDTLFNDDCYECFSSKELQLYKEQEPMGGTIKMNPTEMGGERLIVSIPKGYEFAGVDDDNQQVVFEKIKPQYPKTYEECCDILQLESKFLLSELTITEEITIKPFIQLKRCRDAYWKLAGEQMGLGKPWKPDWGTDIWPDLYYISFDGVTIAKETGFPCCNIILIFPTEEMRDAFYENFKGLIEQCKELL